MRSFGSAVRASLQRRPSAESVCRARPLKTKSFAQSQAHREARTTGLGAKNLPRCGCGLHRHLLGSLAIFSAFHLES